MENEDWAVVECLDNEHKKISMLFIGTKEECQNYIEKHYNFFKNRVFHLEKIILDTH